MTRRRWPIVLIALPAAVSIWSGWVGLGGLTGFGVVHPLPGIWDSAQLNTAITLPVGVEAYGALALGVWLAGSVPDRARAFARVTAVAALALGMLGQVAYHLMAAAHVVRAPWPVTVGVSCLPVVMLGMGAALAHLLRDEPRELPADLAPVLHLPPVPAAVPGPEDREDQPGTCEDRSRRGEDRPPDELAARRDALLSVAEQVAADLASQDRSLSRSSLVRGLRDRGHPIGTNRATELLRQVKAAAGT